MWVGFAKTDVNKAQGEIDKKRMNGVLSTARDVTVYNKDEAVPEAMQKKGPGPDWNFMPPGSSIVPQEVGQPKNKNEDKSKATAPDKPIVKPKDEAKDKQ